MNRNIFRMAILVFMWSPAYPSKPLPTPPGLSQFDRPNRPVPPSPKAAEPKQHVSTGPTIPLSQVKLAHQETAHEIAARNQDLERQRRMQRIEKTLGLDVELRPQAEAGAEGGKGVYKAEWTSSASSGVKSKLAQEDRAALKKEYDELKKIDEQRRAEIRAKATEPVAKDEAIVSFAEAPVKMKPSEAAAAQRAARKQQASDEVSAKDIKKMGRDAALRQGEELENQAQASRPRLSADEARQKREEAQKALAERNAATKAARELEKFEPQALENKAQAQMKEALSTPGFREKYDAWIEKKEPVSAEPSKAETLQEKFFAKTESTKDTIKEAATSFKNKIFGFFGKGKKTSEEPTGEKPVEESSVIPQKIDIYTKWKKVPPTPEMQAEIEKAKTAQLPPPPPEFLAPVEKKPEIESTGIKPSDKANRPTKDSSSTGYGAVKMNPEQVEQARIKFGQEKVRSESDPTAGMTPNELARYNSPGQQARRRIEEQKAKEAEATASNTPPLAPPPPTEVIPPAPPIRSTAKQEEPASGRTDLMEQIKQGTQLKKIDTETIKKPESTDTKDQLQSNIAAAIQARRKHMREDEDRDTESW